MLFHIFKNQEERREFGGSDFLELQFCQLKIGTSIKNIVDTDNIDCWRDDSLYVFGDDWNVFYKHYKNIFNNSVYPNLKCGEIDWSGINYYPPEQIEEMIKSVEEIKPKDYKILSEWLNKAKDFNGVYVLGF